MMLETLLFYFFALLAVVPALMAVTHSNLLYALSFLFLSFLGIAGLFTLLGAPFIALMQVLIAISFLLATTLFFVPFASKTALPSVIEHSVHNKKLTILKIVLGLGLGGFLVKLILTVNWNIITDEEGPLATLKQLGELLCNEYVLPFELIAILMITVSLGIKNAFNRS